MEKLQGSSHGAVHARPNNEILFSEVSAENAVNNEKLEMCRIADGDHLKQLTYDLSADEPATKVETLSGNGQHLTDEANQEDSQENVEKRSENVEDDGFVVGRSIKTRVLGRFNYGSYGSIHSGIFLNTQEKVAVKLEDLHMAHSQLLAEGAAMRHLENGPGIPAIRWFGSHEPRFNVMVMDLLGPNLQQLLTFCGHRFSLKTVLMLADQMLETLDFVHSKEFVHRDIKPDNFAVGLLGTEREGRIYLLDFGLSKRFHRQQLFMSSFSPSSLIPALAGTVRYMALRAHDGHNDQPRDDLESLGYVFVYFLKGRLPWQGIRDCQTREEKLLQIRRTKMVTDPYELCSGLPEQFAAFLEKCRHSRAHAAESCAKHWQTTFRSLASELNVRYDGRFDWVARKEETGQDVREAMDDRGHCSS